MYLWNTNALAKELKEGTLSESDKFKYYMISTIIWISFVEFGPFAPEEISVSSLIQSILSICTMIIGTYICYVVNREGDGIKFIERIICIGIPLFFKVFVLQIFGLILLAIVFGSEPFDSEDILYIWIIYVYAFILTIYYFWRIYVHIKWISHENTGIN